MGVLAFDEAAANQLMTALEQAHDRLQHQDQQRSAAVEEAIVDFAGPYARLFTQTVDAAATDNSALTFALLNLETQINLARVRAQEEQQRLDDVATWEALTEPTFFQRLTKPSGIPATPPVITAGFSASSRVRAASGGPESVSSARPNRLRGFVATARICNRILAEELSSLHSAWSTFRSTCSWVVVDSFTLLDGFEEYLQECEADVRWIDYVADAFEAAGAGASLPNSVLNGLERSALAPAMTDRQLLEALSTGKPLQLQLLFAGSPALLNQLQLMDPKTINTWWSKMSSQGRVDHQNALLELLPRVFGNLEGIPYVDRAEANLLALEEDMSRVTEELAELQNSTGDDATHQERASELQELEKILSDLEHMSTTKFDEYERFLISYEFAEPPLAAISIGNLDTANNITYNVPGMGNSTATMKSWMEASGNLHNAVANKAQDVATVAYMDYVTPPMVPALDVLFNDLARDGGDRLADSIRGLQAVRDENMPQVNGAAHSYAGPTFAHALTQPGVHVDNLYLIATPGMQSHITHADQLNADNVYATRIRNTIWGLEDGFGGLPDEDGDNAAWMGQTLSPVRDTDVMAPEFGAIRSGSDTGTEDVGLPATKHGALAGPDEDGAGHFEEGSENLANIGYAFTNEPEEMSPYVPKGPTPLQEKLVEINDGLEDVWNTTKDATLFIPDYLPTIQPIAPAVPFAPQR